MKVLMTGAGGLLAHAARPRLDAGRHETRAMSHAELDVTDLAAFHAAVRAFRPEWIFHFAAFTRVDDCESSPERAFLVNGLGSRNAALAAADAGASLLAISSDYVFDGAATRPYREYDAMHPINVYGDSKRAGEQAIREVGGRHVIVRTAWLYGPGGGNFVDSILKRARAGDPLKIVDDQRGCPTYTPDLALGLMRLAENAEYGLYHVAGSGEATWFDLAEAAVKEAGLGVRVEPTTTASLGRPAPRPAYSVLDGTWFAKVAGGPLPDWRDGLRRHVHSNGEKA